MTQLPVIDPPEFDPLDGAIFEETPVLRPGTDWHGDLLYMTFPLDREETEPVKGKKGEFKKVRRTRTAVVNSARKSFWYDEDSVAAAGFRFPPQGFMQETDTRWPVDEMRAFIKGKATPITGGQLFLHIRKYYEEYVEYTDEIFTDILPLYVMVSYVYRLFPTIGYLHFNGTAASGKSQNLKLLKALAFNCVWASNLSTASLYRQVDGCPGLICIDEAESFEGERGEELRRLLNAGYKDGEPVLRTEASGDGTFAVRKYDVYSPKALASINPLEPVVQSRCIVIPMQPRSIKPITDFLAADPKWAATRNLLYHWAMQNAHLIGDLYRQWNEGDDNAPALRTIHAPSLTNRTWEITQALIIMRHHVEGLEAATRLATFFSEYFAEQQKSAEEMDRQRMLLLSLPEVLETITPQNDNKGYLLKHIHEIAVTYIDEDAREYYRTKQVSKHLTALGFRSRNKVKGGTTVPIDEDEVRRQFKKRNVVPRREKDIAWLKGEISFAHNRSSSSAPASASLWGTDPDDPATA